MRTRVSILLSCLIFAMAIQVMVPVSEGLKNGYYRRTKTCPKAESIVKSVVRKFLLQDPGLGASLVRLFFHDCFVRGCDASVLLSPSKENPNPERLAIPNNPSLRGFDVIDAAKAALEKACPGIVSCADIIAFAARDASYFQGGISYRIPSGRYDGKISRNADALQFLPAPFFNLTQLKASFLSLGLSELDMVTLSGAHSFGRSHCTSFNSTLFPTIDPTMNRQFALQLRNMCPQNAKKDGVVSQDFVTPNRLDRQYYKNVQSGRALFFSDRALLTSRATRTLVNRYSKNTRLFQLNFGISMVNMGNLGVLGKRKGEIRRICSAVN